MMSGSAPAQWQTGRETAKRRSDIRSEYPAFTTGYTVAMVKISAYIIAYNEAAKIEAAVASVLWADEIVLADSNSTDGTAALAAALGARVVQIPFTGFGELRNRAVEACRHEWIFSLDSDERCTAAVRDEILATI